MPRLIGITGYARHGKGTIANVLKAHGYEVLSFADPVRQMALAINPYVYPKGYQRLSEYVAERGWQEAKKNPEVRRLLQTIGTDAAKPLFGDDCWAEIGIKKACKIIASGGKVCFDDVRFPQEEGENILKLEYIGHIAKREWETISVNPQIWRVTRYNEDGTMFDNGIGTDHPSESQVKYFEPDEEIRNDGNLDDLARKVQDILGVKEGVL